jgi:hypothetical protein
MRSLRAGPVSDRRISAQHETKHSIFAAVPPLLNRFSTVVTMARFSALVATLALALLVGIGEFCFLAEA